MTVTPTGSTTATTGTTGSSSSSSAAAQASLNLNEQDFLQLLTTQLQNQSPTAPMDSTTFIQQLASLSQVEQGVTTNNNLQQLISLTQSNQLNSAASYIGQQVTADASSATLATGGSATFDYTLGSTATNTSISITDSTGAVLYTDTNTTSSAAGQYKYVWNGQETNGSTAPAGTYNFTVTATNANGTAVTTTTQVTGIVTAVNSDGTGSAPTLTLNNGATVPLSKVTGISSADSSTASGV